MCPIAISIYIILEMNYTPSYTYEISPPPHLQDELWIIYVPQIQNGYCLHPRSLCDRGAAVTVSARGMSFGATLEPVVYLEWMLTGIYIL